MIIAVSLSLYFAISCYSLAFGNHIRRSYKYITNLHTPVVSYQVLSRSDPPGERKAVVVIKKLSTSPRESQLVGFGRTTLHNRDMVM